MSGGGGVPREAYRPKTEPHSRTLEVMAWENIQETQSQPGIPPLSLERSLNASKRQVIIATYLPIILLRGG